MIERNNVARLMGLLLVLSLILGWIAVAPVAGAGLVAPAQETPEPEEPVHLPATPEAPGEGETEPPPSAGWSGSLRTLAMAGLVGVAGLAFIAIVVVIFFRPGRGAGVEPEVPTVPITTLAQDIKEGRVSKVVVVGEDLTITRIDGLVLRSHKEHTADLVQLLTNLGVTPEDMGNIIIDNYRAGVYYSDSDGLISGNVIMFNVFAIALENGADPDIPFNVMMFNERNDVYRAGGLGPAPPLEPLQ